MKTTIVKSNQPEVAPSKPFFNKSGKDTFFANGEVQKKDFYNSGSIQASLTVGEPDDPYEKEADKVSRQVVDGFDQVTSIQKKLSTFGLQPFSIQPLTIGNRISRKWQQTLSKTPLVVQNKCDQCEEEQKQAQPKSLGIQFAGDGAMVSPDIESRINSQRGGGSAMDEQTKSAMESSFGADFGGVKVHTDSHAVQMSQQLNAHAFTVGNDIFFNNGRYQPQTKEGAGLLAHELTHTVQQGASLQNKSINRQPFLNTLSNHASAHLSAMNGGGLSALSRKEIAQLEKLPEEEMMKMQQLQKLQMKGVDKVQKKDNVNTLRRCAGPASVRKGKLKSGPTYTPNGSQKSSNTPTSKSFSFSLGAEFENDASKNIFPECGEVRQYIKWDNDAVHPGKYGHTGFQPEKSFAKGVWHEDRDTVGKRYGHRTGSFSECILGNRYEDSKGPNCATGPLYKGSDSPNISGPKAVISGFKGIWAFKLEAIDHCQKDMVLGTDLVSVDFN